MEVAPASHSEGTGRLSAETNDVDKEAAMRRAAKAKIVVKRIFIII